MKKILHMNWNDSWRDYILYGTPHAKYEFDRFGNCYMFDRIGNLDVSPLAICNVMDQLKDSGMSVYEAFLKGMEAKYARASWDIKSIQKELLKLKKAEIKLIKSQNRIDPDDIQVIHDLSNILYQRYIKLKG